MPTSGQALVTAGARGIVATLWPIGNNRAAAIGGRFGELLRATPGADVPTLLGISLRDLGADEFDTAASYVYIGLPGAAPRSAAAISDMETGELLTATFTTFFDFLRPGR